MEDTKLVLHCLSSYRHVVLFTFPTQYYTLSVTGEYLGLEGGPPGFPRDFSCPAVLWILLANSSFRLRASHALWWAFPYPSAKTP